MAISVTVVGATGPGHLKLFAGGVPVPATSAINFGALQTRANTALVALRIADGTLAALPVLVGGGTVDLIIDVAGYFE